VFSRAGNPIPQSNFILGSSKFSYWGAGWAALNYYILCGCVWHFSAWYMGNSADSFQIAKEKIFQRICIFYRISFLFLVEKFIILKK